MILTYCHSVTSVIGSTGLSCILCCSSLTSCRRCLNVLSHRVRLIFADIYSEWSKRWEPKDGVWLVWWMRYQIFAPLMLLQMLNLFWYYLCWRVAYRYALHHPRCFFCAHLFVT